MFPYRLRIKLSFITLVSYAGNGLHEKSYINRVTSARNGLNEDFSLCSPKTLAICSSQIVWLELLKKVIKIVRTFFVVKDALHTV